MYRGTEEGIRHFLLSKKRAEEASDTLFLCRAGLIFITFRPVCHSERSKESFAHRSFANAQDDRPMCHSERSEESFVLRSFANAQDDKTMCHSKRSEESFMLRSFANAQDDKTMCHSERSEESFVFRSFANAQDDKHKVKSFTGVWDNKIPLDYFGMIL